MVLLGDLSAYNRGEFICFLAGMWEPFSSGWRYRLLICRRLVDHVSLSYPLIIVAFPPLSIRPKPLLFTAAAWQRSASFHCRNSSVQKLCPNRPRTYLEKGTDSVSVIFSDPYTKLIVSNMLLCNCLDITYWTHSFKYIYFSLCLVLLSSFLFSVTYGKVEKELYCKIEDMKHMK